MTHRSKSGFVQPVESPSACSEAIHLFAEAGWSQADAGWLAPLCLRFAPRTSTEDDALDDTAEHNLKVLAETLGQPPDRNGALLRIFVRLCGLGGLASNIWYPSTWRAPGTGDWVTIASELRANRPHAQGADLEAALVAGGWPGEYGTGTEMLTALRLHAEERPPEFAAQQPLVQVMRLLLKGAKIDLTRVVDVEAVVAHGEKFRANPNDRLAVPEDRRLHHPFNVSPRSLAAWLTGIGPKVLSLIYPVLLAQPVERQVVLAMGIRDAIERWLVLCLGHETSFDRAGNRLSAHTAQYVDHLERLMDDPRTKNNPLVRRAWLWFAWCTFAASDTGPDPARREKMLRAATEDVAHLRKLFSRAASKVERPSRSASDQTPEPWEEFEWERDHFQTCTFVLYDFGGVWRAMKPLLLALRALNAPAVASDVRYWHESKLEPPPEPWYVVPAWMINMFHARVGREQASDPDLRNLRGDLASFCLERLVDRWTSDEREQAKKAGRRRSNEDMMERSWEWRYALVRAVGALGINPEGKGHRTLHVAAEHDPDDRVREAARQVYQQLRRGAHLPENTSPRRAVMSALWWIRQAHLLGLGIQPDPDGAQRTRIKELTRTKESERGDNPESQNN